MTVLVTATSGVLLAAEVTSASPQVHGTAQKAFRGASILVRPRGW